MNRNRDQSGLIPGVQWLRPDITAGLTTTAVVVPNAMAHAAVAGRPLQVGLYTIFVPVVVNALLGTSQLLNMRQ